MPALPRSGEQSQNVYENKGQVQNVLLKRCPGEDLEAFLEAVGVEGFLALAVVERVIRAKPVAFPVDVQIANLGIVWGLDQHLLLGTKVVTSSSGLSGSAGARPGGHLPSHTSLSSCAMCGAG